MKKRILTNVFGSAFLSAVLFATMLLSACEDDHDKDHEGELITTVSLRFTETDQAGTPVQGVTPLVFSWEDLDGDGSGQAEIQTIVLKAQTRYIMEVDVRDEANGVNITEEIQQEEEEHQFFFTATGVALTVTYDDADSDNRPVGLRNRIQTGAAGTGTFQVVLRHEPDKAANGVSSGNITNAGGDTDIEADFPVTLAQ